MSRIASRLLRIADRQPDFTIGSDASPYLRRWWVIPRNPIFNVYLHQFLRSDDDRALHDHPWWNVSVLLKGQYREHTIMAGGIERRKMRCAGNVKFRLAKCAHRIELTDGPCWTLFITGPRFRSWGFHCPVAGWVHWRDFTAADDHGQVGRGCSD